MGKRRFTVDWGYLRFLIESTLSGLPGFPKNLRLDGKLRAACEGMGHDNYFFSVGKGRYVLRLAKRYRPLRTPEEARECLMREAETLRVLERCPFPYPAPRLVSAVRFENEFIGFIETCVYGIPLKEREGDVNGRSRLEIIGEIAAAVHALPLAEFGHLQGVPDSLAHV